MKHAGRSHRVIRAWEGRRPPASPSRRRPGFDPAAKAAGTGFVNMGDRLGAIGGSCGSSPPRRRDQITGVLPLSGRTARPGLGGRHGASNRR